MPELSEVSLYYIYDEMVLVSRQPQFREKGAGAVKQLPGQDTPRLENNDCARLRMAVLVLKTMLQSSEAVPQPVYMTVVS